MRLRSPVLWLGVLGCLCAATGCNEWANWKQAWSAAEPEADDEFADLAGGDFVADDARPATAAPSDPASLQLNLKVGDRFPLLKSVEQTLVQTSAQGELTSNSYLEMLLALTVEEIPEGGERAGQKRMGVKYHRVKFRQDLSGKRLDYDSQSAGTAIPPEVQPYHGLIGNGFYFWLGPNNQLVDMVGFEPFLQRCLEAVPAERRQQVATSLLATSGADGIANFVDDSIGLLPTHAVKVGDTWSGNRDVFEPLRMHIKTQYTLHKIDDQAAEVSILGRIDPTATFGVSEAPQHVNVSVRGGRSYGTCLIDRRSGLPIQSQVEQNLEMDVKLANGMTFGQQKRTITKIRAFPEQGAAGSETPGTPTAMQEAPAAMGAVTAVTPASFETPQPPQPHP